MSENSSANPDAEILTSPRDEHPTARSVSRAAAVLRLFAGLIFAHVAHVTRAADWPQFLGATRNGVYSGPALAETWPKDGPPRVWQRNVGHGFSGPVVSGGRLILFHRIDDNEIVECLDAKTGKVFWKSEYPTAYRDDFGFDPGPRSTPAVAEGRVYTFGAEGTLHCWDLSDGRKVWGVETQKQFGARQGFFGLACSPLVESNAVIVNIGGRDGAGIVGFDTATGRVRWKATDDGASYSSPVAITVHQRRCVLVITLQALVALAPANGRVLFRYEWRPPMHAAVSAATPLVIDDLIFISASYGTGASLLRFQESGPEKVWSADDVLSNHYATSVPHDGFLYGRDGRQEQGCDLRGVELKTGKVRWSESGLNAGTVTLAGDQLLVLTEKGELLRALASPAGFKPAARAQILPFVVRAHPALADGLFYARSKDKLVCVGICAPIGNHATQWPGTMRLRAQVLPNFSRVSARKVSSASLKMIRSSISNSLRARCTTFNKRRWASERLLQWRTSVRPCPMASCSCWTFSSLPI